MKRLAPLSFLVVVLGFVTLLALSGALGGEERPEASAPSAPATIVIELEGPPGGTGPEGSPETAPSSDPGTTSTSRQESSGEEDLSEEAEADSSAAYVVKEGDSPYSIARSLDVPLEELMELNGIDDPTSLQVGDVLQVPGA